MYPQIDLKKVRVYPLAQRASMSRIEEIAIAPDSQPAGPLNPFLEEAVRRCAEQILQARASDASVFLIYGAHLVKNGASLIVDALLQGGWVSHLATNGAGCIHDWEFAFQAWSTESVEKNVATGTFGTWQETGRNIHLALLAGAVRGEGFGESVGRFIEEEGATLPDPTDLHRLLTTQPDHELAPARAELLLAMKEHGLSAGKIAVPHPWKKTSIFRNAYVRKVPLTVHPGIGYDIISNHPMFNGAVLGRAAGIDFKVFGASLERLDGGVVMSVGSAIMGPQVFEKSISCVNNLRLQQNRKIVHDHSIYVVDLQDGGNWDWRKGEPPKENPAYYLRFCKSFSRMGGTMNYLQCDNVLFLHHLLHLLRAKAKM